MVFSLPCPSVSIGNVWVECVGEDVHMKLTLLILTALVAWAQQPAARGPQPPAPPLMECGTHGDVEILCGTRSPEDLEETPDGKYLIVSQFVNG